MIFLFKWMICRFGVNVPGCKLRKLTTFEDHGHLEISFVNFIQNNVQYQNVGAAKKQILAPASNY